MGRALIAVLRSASWRAAAITVLCAAMLLVPGRLQASDGFAPGSICHISTDTSMSYRQAAQTPGDWNCDDDLFDWNAARHIIRHDLSGLTAVAAYPRYAEFDRFEFDRLTVTAEAIDGTIASRSFGFEDLKLGPSSLRAMIELPDPGGPLRTITFIHEGGQYPDVFVDAEFARETDTPAVAGYYHLLAALFCGLLLTPAIFDLIFYRALREPFLLYHSLFCMMAVIQTAAVSGLLPMVTGLSYSAELSITYLSLDLMIAATFLFAYRFIERKSLTPRHRRWLLAMAGLAVANGLVGTFLIDPLADYIDYIYFGVLVVLFGAYFPILLRARRNASRVAVLLALGILPLFLIILAQTVSVYALGESGEFDETWPQNFALLFEVLATALAVADRFLIIRRQRDRALVTARDLEAITEHDELTGLRNRRSLEIRYPELVKDGFNALALVDLDDFKAINDDFGHPVGDRVIRSAAWALSPGDDDNLIAFRMGGEEFLLLLRGKDAAEKAEARRKAMTARILAEVDEVDRPVTASMGFVDFGDLASAEATESFGKLYVLADRLLYDAKCSGRDAAEMEKLRAEDPIPRFSHQAAE
ncbi:GGDEF domain-containing protein [Qipengyuania flava]|nr:GGDEF domain-containing protein [Qipengyuania flava]